MASKTYNVGIIGYGLSAKIFHIPFVNEVDDFKFYAVVQRRPQPDDDAEKDWPGVKSYRSTEDMVADPKVDIVVVGTTPATHFDLAKMALEAGKHVIVEKPFMPTSKEASDLFTLASSRSLICAVYQNRRYDSDFLTVQKLISSNTLGRISEFETHFDRHRPDVPSASSWKTEVAPGTGVVYDLGTHLMDQCISLFGFPSHVTGIIGTSRENNNTAFEDTATILLHYPSTTTRPAPLLCTVKATVVSPEKDQLRYWIRGTKASFKKFHLDIQEDQLKANLRPGDVAYGLEPKDRYGVLSKWNDAEGKAETEVVPTVEPATYCEFYRKVARALNGDLAQLPVKPDEAVGLIRLVELARQSSTEGKTLPF